VPLENFRRELGLRDEERVLKTIANATRAAGREIIRAKGATYYGIGAALVRIVRAILRDEQAVLTVSGLVPQSMGLGEVFPFRPSLIGTESLVCCPSHSTGRSKKPSRPQPRP
jgi:L-lactate dehydrogenase